MPGTTPVYGFPYPEPTDLVADYPALGQQLAEDIEDVLPTIVGLAPAKPTSIANSGGTATLSGNTVTFSGVSSVSLNGCFTANYDNYRITSTIVGTADTAISFRLRASGTDNSAAQYNIIGYFVVTAQGPTRIEATGQTSARFGSTNTTGYVNNMEIRGPFVAGPTRFVSDVAGNLQRSSWGGSHEVTSSFDGITLIPAAGTISGNIQVFGYRL